MSHASDDEGEQRQPRGGTDVQSAKLELLRLGKERGYIAEGEIEDTLPSSMITPTELETFLFTLEMMDIEIRFKDGSRRVRAKPSGQSK